MKLEKKDIINICKIVAFGIILYLGLQNIGLIGECIKKIGGILSPFIVGSAIAFIVNIPMTFFEKKVFISKKKKNYNKFSKGKRLVSIFFSLIIIILIFIGVIFLIIPDLLDVIKQAVNYLPELFANIKVFIKQGMIDYPEVADILNNLQSNLDTFNAEVIKDLTSFGTNLVASSFQMISYTVSAVVNTIISIIFAIYLLMGKESICRNLKRMMYAYLSKKNANKITKIAQLSKTAFNNFLTGQFTECIILGTLCGLGMFILGLPYSATIGTLVAITACIPMIGALIGAIVGVILILPVSFVKAIIFIIFFIILQQIENNLIYPRVVGNRVGVPGVLVLITVVVGGTLFGAIGMIVGLPMVAVLYTLILENISKRLKNKGIEE